jgi:2-polyprenyl-3-methyl-5-hydroxy-6-metoxy-1,4-benzoquinol methylase
VELTTKSLEDIVAQTSRKYDVVILSHVLEHVADLGEFIETVKILMHDNSLLYIEVPGISRLHINPAYKCCLENYLVHAHMYHFTGKTLAKILDSCKMKQLKINDNVEAVFALNSSNFKIINNEIDSVDLEIYLKRLIQFRQFYCVALYARLFIQKVTNRMQRLFR